MCKIAHYEHIRGFLFNSTYSLIKKKDQARVLKFMKKIFILLTSMFLLVGCIESMALIGGGATNGKFLQSSLQSGVSLGIKNKTGKSPLQHALNYSKKVKPKAKEKESSNKPSKKPFLSLQSSINKKSKIKYLD